MRAYRVYSSSRATADRTRTRTFAAMIKRGGFVWVDPDIKRGFRHVKPNLFTVAGSALFSIDSDMTTKQVKALMKRDGFEPASIERLLAFGAEIRERRRDPIVALANPWMDPIGMSYVPCLSQLHNGRYVKIAWDWPTHQWPKFFKFLACRK